MSTNLSYYINKLKVKENAKPLYSMDELEAMIKLRPESNTLAKTPGGFSNMLKMFSLGALLTGALLTTALYFGIISIKNEIAKPAIQSEKGILSNAQTKKIIAGKSELKKKETLTKSFSSANRKDIDKKSEKMLLASTDNEIQTKRIMNDIKSEIIIESPPAILYVDAVPHRTLLKNDIEESNMINSLEPELKKLNLPEHHNTISLNLFYLAGNVIDISYEGNSGADFSYSIKGSIGQVPGYSSTFVTTTGINEKSPSLIYAIGAQVSYYMLGNFDNGLQIGLDGTFYSAGYDASIAANPYGDGKGFILAPFAGYKLILNPGFTLNAQFGIGLNFSDDFIVSDYLKDGTADGYYSTDVKPGLILRINFGWSF